MTATTLQWTLALLSTIAASGGQVSCGNYTAADVTAAVRAVQRIPRPAWTGQAIEVWDGDTTPDSNYISSLSITPGIFLLAGVAFLSLSAVRAGRPAILPQPAVVGLGVTLSFVLGAAVVFLVVGYTSTSAGAAAVGQGAAVLDAIVGQLSGSIAAAEYSTITVAGLLNTTTCVGRQEDIVGAVRALAAEAYAVADTLSTMGNTADQVSHALATMEEISDAVSLAALLLLLQLLLLCALGGFCLWARALPARYRPSPCGDQDGHRPCCLGAVVAIAALLWVLCTALLLALLGLADTCSCPTAAVSHNIRSPAAERVFEHYSLCARPYDSGNTALRRADLFAEYAAILTLSLKSFNASAALDPACREEMEDGIAQSERLEKHALAAGLVLERCDPTAAAWERMVALGACGRLFTGLYISWVAACVLAAALLLLLPLVAAVSPPPSPLPR